MRRNVGIAAAALLGIFGGYMAVRWPSSASAQFAGSSTVLLGRGRAAAPAGTAGKNITPLQVTATTVIADAGIFDTVTDRQETAVTVIADGGTFATLAAQSITEYAGLNAGAVTPTGWLNINTASTGNGGSCAAGVDLTTYTVQASTLIANNRCLVVTAYGTTANNATAKNIDLAIGATPTVLVTKALTVSIAGTWNVSAVICRTGSNAQTSWAEAFNNGGTTVSSTDGATVLKNTSFSTPALTEASQQLLRVRCITNANAANDIVQKGLLVGYL